MTKRLFVVVLCAFLQILAPAIASADSRQFGGVTVSDGDVKMMLVALHHALQPNDDAVLVAVSMKTAAEMPVYERDWHYAGTDQKDGKPNVHVWLVQGLSGVALQHAITASFMLGLADAGYGGAAWKNAYVAAAAADSALGSDAKDPFVNRRKLAESMSNLAESDSGLPKP